MQESHTFFVKRAFIATEKDDPTECNLKRESESFCCQIFEFLVLVRMEKDKGHKRRFGRIYNKSEEVLQLSKLDKKRSQFLGREREREKKKDLRQFILLFSKNEKKTRF